MSIKSKKCPFCNILLLSTSEILFENIESISIKDKYPVVKDHVLIIPKRHVSSFFNLTTPEKNHCILMLDIIKDYLLEKDKTITGFNVGFNDGTDAGQTIFHCHIHVIPRRKNDVLNPVGGIRNIIPGKGIYD